MTVKVKICVKYLYQVKIPTIRKSKKWQNKTKTQWSHYKSGFLQNLNKYTRKKTSPKGETFILTKSSSCISVEQVGKSEIMWDFVED